MSAATSSLRQGWNRAQAAWQASPVPAFLAWWAGELLACLPTRWRAALGGGATWYLLRAAGEGWQLGRAGEAEPLAHWSDALAPAQQQAVLASAWSAVDAVDRRLALLLPANAVLRRVLHLPLAARARLHAVAGFELDRQTPFTAAQVYWSVREAARPAAAGQLAAELFVVRRDTLDPLLARLAANGIVVDAVDAAEGDGRSGINLLPPGRAPRHVRPRLRLNLALGAACLVLLGLMMGGWLHNRQAALVAMQARVDAMHAQAAQVAALRRQLQDDVGAAGFLARRKAQRPGALAVLLDLTNRLPASAWLERFSLDDSGQVGFQGQSPQAAGLLDLLKGSALIDNASFQGSIQADPTSGKERFYMVAQLRDGSPAAKAGAPATAGSAP